MLGFRHLRTRVRVSRGLEPFPAIGFWKRVLDYVMYSVGIIAPAALVPQIVQVYSTKSAEGLSLITWAMLALFNVLWLVYGAVHKDKHIVFANVLMFIFNGVIVLGILLY